PWIAGGDKMRFFSYMPEYVEIYPDYYVFEFLDFIKEATRHVNDELTNIAGLNVASNNEQ
ncbi:MAG: hypothetical protein DRG83_12655, partial [Deltaproteobacteria bacterium]